MSRRNRHFSTVSKETLSEYAGKTNYKQRSPALRKAWGEKDVIKLLRSQGSSLTELAKIYNVSVVNIHRIVKSD